MMCSTYSTTLVSSLAVISLLLVDIGTSYSQSNGVIWGNIVEMGNFRFFNTTGCYATMAVNPQYAITLLSSDPSVCNVLHMAFQNNILLKAEVYHLATPPPSLPEPILYLFI